MREERGRGMRGPVGAAFFGVVHCITLHYMESQMTLRLPRDMVRALSRRAKDRRVPRSQLVREALARYLAEPETMSDEEFEARLAKYVGSVQGDQEAMLADPLARQIYEHNWRE